MELSPANYRDVKDSSNSFTALAAYNGTAMSLVGQGEPQRVEGSSVTANLFSVLETRTLIGRTFQDKDGQAGAPGTVVLSYSLWQTAFGGDRDILGKAVSLDNQPYTVIGVMPHDFRFPTRGTLFWTPFRLKKRITRTAMTITWLASADSSRAYRLPRCERTVTDRRPVAAPICERERGRGYRAGRDAR